MTNTNPGYPPEPPTSYMVEVIADSSGTWCGNGLRFATVNEAEHYGFGLALRWTAVRDYRVVRTADPVNRPKAEGGS